MREIRLSGSEGGGTELNRFSLPLSLLLLLRRPTLRKPTMTKRTLNAIFRPSSIAVIGAGSSVASVGGTVWRNVASSGFIGDVFPINLKHDSVQGVRAFASIKHVPQPIDLAVICVPAPFRRSCANAVKRAYARMSVASR